MSFPHNTQLHTASLFPIFVFLLITALLPAGSNLHAQEKEKTPPPVDVEESEYKGIMKNLERGVWIPNANWHFYVNEGFRIDSPEKNFTLKINLGILVDGGYISADEALDAAFPTLEGPEFNFRWLRVTGFGTIYDWAQFKVDLDFANIREFRDNSDRH